MQSRHYPEVPPDFGHWLAGFIDGEGSFSIDRFGGGRKTISWGCRLAVLLRDDDRPILEEIFAVTGIGCVMKHPRIIEGSNPGATWRASTKPDCCALVGLFDRFPLRAKKRRDYAIWREAVLNWKLARRWGGNQYSRRHPVHDWARMEQLSTALKTGRVYQGSVLVPKPGEMHAIPAGDDVVLF